MVYSECGIEYNQWKWESYEIYIAASKLLTIDIDYEVACTLMLKIVLNISFKLCEIALSLL
jgi:hypothetical protein